jgi:NAD(P)-dependent dehydrogenase (short-subunit alcohol dehydrogenase family)
MEGRILRRMYFDKKVAIVTGGASGIGRALCKALASRGATVVAADIRPVGDIVATDVTKAAEVQALVDDTVRRHGRIDLMFNNAGIGVSGEIRDLTLEHWRAVIDVNLMGVVHGVAAAYPVMLRQGSGHIVNIASLAGLITSPGLAPYETTKGAVVSLTNALRAEAEAYGVRASVVCPGFVDTNIYENAIGVKVDKDAILKRLKLPMLPVADATRAILRGVERNRGMIVFPASARVMWRLTQFAPWLLTPLQRRMTAGQRELHGGRVPR